MKARARRTLSMQLGYLWNSDWILAPVSSVVALVISQAPPRPLALWQQPDHPRLRKALAQLRQPHS